MTRRSIVKGTLGLTGAAALAMSPTASRVRGARQGGPMQIEYWHRLAGDSALAIEALAQQFNEEQAGAIEVAAVAQGDIAQLTQKVRAAAAGGGLPAALMADDADVLAYSASDVIVPLDSYLTSAEFGLTADEQADFLPNQLTRHKLPLYDNQTMTFPIGFSTYTFYWNSDALANAGITQPPATWAEFPDAVRAVAAANDGMVFHSQPNLGSVFIFVLMTHGVSWLKESGTESNFDAPEALETMTWLQELGTEGLLVPDESHDELFAAGRSSFFLQSSVNARRFPETVSGFAWDAGLPPQGAAGSDPLTEMFGPLNVLPKTDEATQLAGWTWLKWLATPQPHAQFNEAAGYFPARLAAAEHPILADYYAAHPIHEQLFEEVAPVAQIPRPGPGLVEVRGPIASDVITAVLLGRLPAADAVRQLKAEADAAIQIAS
jgi:sn-glycerol 3-phosphate transport system substrate-binding protein